MNGDAAVTTTTLTLDHRDTGVHHNFSIHGDSSLEQVVFEGEVILGPAVNVYELPALSAGEYYFQCDVHPSTMHGTVVTRER